MSSVNAQRGSVASMAGNAPSAESRDVSRARAAAYSHDNVFARIHARDEDPGAADLGGLEADMAASQPPAGQDGVAQADLYLVVVGSQFD